MSYNVPLSYQVLITPLVDKDTYGSTVDVTKDIDISDQIKDGGIGKIKREVDNGDYDIGVFTYGNITLKASNIDGRFNNENDYRSIFKYSRDKAKVEIKFYDSNSSATISFKGIINEEGTKQDFLKDEVKFKVLSLDSVLRKTKIAAGVVSNGTTFSDAIKSIINVPSITSVLNYSASYVNVGLDLAIDDGSYFDNKTVKDGLDALMVASNSVMVVDSSDYMVVRDRTENSGSVFQFYGHGDLFGRENIIAIKAYNTGFHRMFNSVVVNDYESSNTGLIDVYNLRQKKTNVDFITDSTKSRTIADTILGEFKAPKVELELVTTTEIAKGLSLFDLVSIDYPYEVKPYGDHKLPLYGSAVYGTAVYPYIRGNIKIRANEAFKVIGVSEDPKKFLTTVKLRQRGTTLSDGTLSAVSTYYGSAIYGTDVYVADPSRVDPSILAYYGGALYGTVHYGGI